MRDFRIKEAKKEKNNEYYEKGYIPMTFEAMLNYVYSRSERDNIRCCIGVPSQKETMSKE